MEQLSSDPKQNAILTAAWETFATYGFRKTSMDDIARGAGMSRPALYRHYKNKEDIFRSLSQIYYDKAALNVETALAGRGSIRDILERAFLAHYDEVVETMMSSPHGDELLDTSFKACADLAEVGEARIQRIYSAWLQAQADAGHLNLPAAAADVAGTMAGALKGLKLTAQSYDEFRQKVSILARVAERGIRAD